MSRFIYIDDCNEAFDNDQDMHLKGVSESMKTDDRADMKSTGTAVRQERASRKLQRGKYTNKDRVEKRRHAWENR